MSRHRRLGIPGSEYPPTRSYKMEDGYGRYLNGESCRDAFCGSSCADIVQLVCCLGCILLTWGIALSLPTLTKDLTLDYLEIETEPPRYTTPEGHPRIRGQWQRNSTHLACAERCFWDGKGSVVIQSFDHKWRQSQWPLQDSVKGLLCFNKGDHQLRKAQIRAHHSHPALYTMGMGQPFQTQNLRYNGVVFIAEVKVRDVLSRSRRLAGRGGHRGASSNNAQSHKRNSHSQKGNRKFREKAPAENYVVKRIAGAERSTSSEAGYLFRHALNVLSSFDLILLGDWEADPIQRRALLSLILGPKQTLGRHGLVSEWSDEDIALTLGLPNENRPVVPPEVPASKTDDLSFYFQLFNRNNTAINNPPFHYPSGHVCPEMRGCYITRGTTPARLMPFKQCSIKRLG